MKATKLIKTPAGIKVKSTPMSKAKMPKQASF